MLIAGLGGQAFAQDADVPAPQQVSTPSEAAPTDGSYHGICWGGPITGCAFETFPAVNPPFEFDCGVGSCWLTVVDGGIADDQIEVFDFGSSIGITSVPFDDNSAVCPFTDADVCLANPNFSSGMFCLGPGQHAVTMTQLLAPLSGGGWFKVELHNSNECQAVGGEFLSIDSTALILAGAQTNAVWIMSALAVIGSMAFGALYITSKKN